jgi:hypothetical protein
MGQDSTNPDKTGTTPAQESTQESTQQSVQESITSEPITDSSQDEQTVNTLATMQDHAAADDLLHAAHILPAETIANVELTLDHLSTTVDLFDVPLFDYGDGATGSDS